MRYNYILLIIAALCPAVCSMTVCIDDLISIKDLADQYKKDIKTFLQNPSVRITLKV